MWDSIIGSAADQTWKLNNAVQLLKQWFKKSHESVFGEDNITIKLLDAVTGDNFLKSSIKIENLVKLENTLKTLRSPKWRSEFGEINQKIGKKKVKLFINKIVKNVISSLLKFQMMKPSKNII